MWIFYIEMKIVKVAKYFRISPVFWHNVMNLKENLRKVYLIQSSMVNESVMKSVVIYFYCHFEINFRYK